MTLITEEPNKFYKTSLKTQAFYVRFIKFFVSLFSYLFCNITIREIQKTVRKKTENSAYMELIRIVIKNQASSVLLPERFKTLRAVCTFGPCLIQVSPENDPSAVFSRKREPESFTPSAGFLLFPANFFSFCCHCRIL